MDGRLRAIYADHSAKGLLRSGATVKVALAAMEDIASKLITSCVDQVATIAKDVEAFGMIQETVEGLLRFLGGHVSGVTVMASGTGQVLKAAETRFSESLAHLRRQLEIQRFTFTVPQWPLSTVPPPAAALVPAPIVTKSRGGKPLAAHWDEMWAAVAVMLYEGDLQPKTQADIERTMKDWLAARDLDGGDSAVRTRARQLWQKLPKAE